jgi:hypothetical protein
MLTTTLPSDTGAVRARWLVPCDYSSYSGAVMCVAITRVDSKVNSAEDEARFQKWMVRV